jgi:NAD(P)H-hydrate epimerase
MNKIFTSKDMKQVDQLAAKHLAISSYQLMQKAGAAIFSYIQHNKNILVATGAGNNAGDGFIVAKLALDKGHQALVWSLIDIHKLPPDAQMAAQEYIKAGGKIITQAPDSQFDCIVDGLLGTGLCRDVSGVFAEAIAWINSQDCPTISIDIPSGLDADTGDIRGSAINAQTTVTVIAYKAGLLTNYGKDCCGQLFLEDLNIEAKTFNQVDSRIYKLDETVLNHPLFNHHNNSHKGSFGKVMIAGGHDGMLGALMLSGQSALQSGCGMVEVVSNAEQAVMISIHCPELITANSIDTARFLPTADVIAVGPGLGLNQQSKQVLATCIKQNKPMVIDADGLTLIAQSQPKLSQAVLTPHPKEAASLLNTDVVSIQADRISAAKLLSKTYQATVILKGSGSVIADCNGDVYICPFGYSGMATAGMGDVLTGIVAGLLAQGFSPIDAANCAVVWHALAAVNCHKGNCLIASDVVNQLYEVINR